MKPFRTCDRIITSAKWLPVAWRMWLQQRLQERHARWNGMSRARAENLMAYLQQLHFKGLGFKDFRDAALPMNVPLVDFIIAERIISELHFTLRPDGESSGPFLMADRGIAAIYAIEHWGVDALAQVFGGLLSESVFEEEEQDVKETSKTKNTPKRAD